MISIHSEARSCASITRLATAASENGRLPLLLAVVYNDLCDGIAVK